MGYYVNPPGESKEAWLFRNGVVLPCKPQWEDIPEGCLPVVLMDNGPFTVAGVAFSEKELDAFTQPTDFRPKVFYMVEISDLLPVSTRGLEKAIKEAKNGR